MSDPGYMSLVGRVLLGSLFLVSGLHKITDPGSTQQYMTAMGITAMTTILYVGAVAVELAGSLSLLLGYRARVGAWLLVVFMVPTTLIFHSQLGDQNQAIHFLKNLSIMGGLLYVARYGAGALSMDAGLERARSTAPPHRILKRAAHE